MMWTDLYNNVLLFCMILLAFLTLIAIIRSVKGPRIADRIIAINMIGTMTIALICLLAIYLKEDYLLDVCLIYAMVSFLSVVVLARIFTGIYREKQMKKTQQAAEKDSPAASAVETPSEMVLETKSAHKAFANGEKGEQI